MGINTTGVIQVYDVVPALKPNVGKPSFRDGTTQELQDQVFTDEMKRDSVVTTYNASTIPSPLDTQLSKRFVVNMNASIAGLSLVAGEFDGQILMIILKQDAIGGRTLTYNASSVQAGQDVGLPALNGTANSRDYHLLSWNATNSKWDFVTELRRYP